MGLLRRIKTGIANKRTAKAEAVKQVNSHQIRLPADLRKLMIKTVYKRKLKELRAAQRAKK
jgi:hypothetical protein